MNIIIRNLDKSYGCKKVLQGLNMTLEDKAISFIRGKSGVGKTSLIRILLGLEEKDGGHISGLENKKKSVVFQNQSLCKNLSVYLNLKLVNSDIEELDLINLLDNLDLNNVLYKRVSQLSGGMARRVDILRAIIYESDLMFLDEPFKGLDKETKQLVMDFVIKNTLDKTVVIVTHQEEEINHFQKLLGSRVNIIDM